jgi:hypothetical protein
MASGRAGFTTRASCLLAAGGTALACGFLLGIVDLARAGVLALAVPLLSASIVLRSRVRIANRRRIEPRRATSGDTVTMHLTITNRSLIPTGSLMLEDQLPTQIRGNARFVLDGLFSRESRTVSYRMPRLPRGRYRAGPLHIRLTDPFHLVDVRRSFTATSEIVVAPVVERLRSADPGDAAGVAVGGGFEGDPSPERVAGDMRAVETLVIEEGLEHVAQHVRDGASVSEQVGRLPVAGQIDQDHLAVHRQIVQDGVPRLTSMRQAVNENQWLAGTVSFAGEHAVLRPWGATNL